VTYGDLVRRSEQLAAALAADLKPGQRVGLLARNHVGFVEAAVAIATVGADAVLMNTGLSGPQLANAGPEAGPAPAAARRGVRGRVGAVDVPCRDLASFADAERRCRRRGRPSGWAGSSS
jgi:acyl-coenzyme A synthetase/AMP-(fatty) acid ligase